MHIAHDTGLPYTSFPGAVDGQCSIDSTRRSPLSPQPGPQDQQALSAIAQSFVEARQHGRSLPDFPGQIPP
ncbi:MAG TPA: 2-keto-4-pentenoate hydratase, partial [Stenotrophomonas sp.]|nr:2-keto-4-pentenoate hydratase [Stenotrophomonas sp.]